MTATKNRVSTLSDYELGHMLGQITSGLSGLRESNDRQFGDLRSDLNGLGRDMRAAVDTTNATVNKVIERVQDVETHSAVQGDRYDEIIRPLLRYAVAALGGGALFWLADRVLSVPGVH